MCDFHHIYAPPGQPSWIAHAFEENGELFQLAQLNLCHYQLKDFRYTGLDRELRAVPACSQESKGQETMACLNPPTSVSDLNPLAKVHAALA